MALDTETLKEAEKSLWRYLYGPTCDGVLVPADPYEAYRCGVASDIEFIFGIPTTEARVVKAFIGQERFECMVSEEMEEIMLALGPSFEERLQKYVEEHQDIPDKIEAYAKFVEQWRALSMYCTAANLVKGGATVRLMYWDEEPLIKNLGSGTVDVVASMLGNNEVLEMHGSLADDDVSESLQGFLAKFAKGQELKLYPNEIKGFEGIEWETFPKALIVSDHRYSCGPIEDRLMDTQFLRDTGQAYL
jgi:para-nitrobenzyl esterase